MPGRRLPYSTSGTAQIQTPAPFPDGGPADCAFIWFACPGIPTPAVVDASFPSVINDSMLVPGSSFSVQDHLCRGSKHTEVIRHVSINQCKPVRMTKAVSHHLVLASGIHLPMLEMIKDTLFVPGILSFSSYNINIGATFLIFCNVT